MKIYKLLNTNANKEQYEKFLEQYNGYKKLEVRTPNQDSFLKSNEYRLKVVWEDGDVKEVEPIKEESAKDKALDKLMTILKDESSLTGDNNVIEIPKDVLDEVLKAEAKKKKPIKKKITKKKK